MRALSHARTHARALTPICTHANMHTGLREDEALLCKHERKYLLPFTGVDTHGVNKDVPSSAQTRGASIRGVGTEMKGERAKRTAAEGVRDESRAGVGITGHEKFDAFCEHVCAMCDKRDHDCGCDVGVDSGVFQLLYNYTRQYEAWAAQATYWADNDYQVTAGSPGAMEGVKFVIVDVCCGIGNHLLMAARGLMLALRLGRALIINEENEVVYALTSVLPLISPDVAARLGWPHRSTKIIATDHRDGHLGVEFYTCGDWHALADHDFIQLQGMEDVHMMMLHPDEGSWFRSYFGDTPFFFLSHFLWSGTEQMSFPVRTESWPRTEQYSGQNFSIEGLISTLRDDAAGALAPDHHRAAILGVQLRVGGSIVDDIVLQRATEITTKLEHNVIDLVGDGTSEEQEAQGEVGEQGEPRSLVADYASNSHWEQLLLFPHGHLLEEEWDGLDLSPLARYCLGDKTALDVVQPCIAKAISDLKNSAQTERILLLLATDREEPLQDLINSVSAQPGVTVVRIYAAKHVDTKIRHLSQQLRALSPDDSRTLEVRRQRALLATGVGLVDVVVLPEVCEGFLGTAHSTYSFAIHARARLIPRYTGHTQDGCYKARSSEGGLISLSPQLSPAQELEGSCTMAYFTATHGCIETRAHCLSTDHISAWAEPLAISFDWFGFYALMYARSGWRDIFFVSHTGIVCNNPHEKEVVSGQILPILRDFQQFGPRGNNQQRKGNAEKRSERTEGGGTNPNLDASCRKRDDTDGWECDKKHDDIPISHPLMSGASHTCAEQGALAPLGSVSIVIHRDALGQEDVSVWDKFDGFFEVSVRFAVIFQDDTFNADDIDTVVFSTGEDVMHVRGVGHHEVVLRKLEEGFHQIRFIAVNASCLFSDSSIRRCVYEDDRTGGLTGCLGVLGGGALPMLKVNLYGYTLLSPAMDPASLYKDQAAGYQKRPVAWEIACGYSVCGMGHVLSDLVVILNGSYLGAVSPLVPNPGMQLEESDWSCRFMLQKLSGQGGAVRWTSVGGVETTKAVFESDWMHTFRLLCAIPSHLQSQLVGNSTREKREGGRALKQSRVLGGLFRDGVPLNMQAVTSETNAPWQSDRDKEPEASSEEEAAIGLSRLVYDPLVRSHPGGNEERRGSVEICTMVRDEEENVEEFVEYHLLLGVRHIHVYLHMTRDSTAHRLEKYVRQVRYVIVSVSLRTKYLRELE